jgi:hypothetical protein
MRSFLVTVFISGLCLGLVALCWASQLDFTISVVDREGPVSGATVTLTNILDSRSRVEITDTAGDALFVSLETGTSEVMVEAAGYNTYTETLVIDGSRYRRLIAVD